MSDEVVERAQALATETFIASSGPGGQNVNKVATAVQLRLDVYALRLTPPVFKHLKELAGSRMTAKGELVLTARRFRTQEANRADARVEEAENAQLPEERNALLIEAEAELTSANVFIPFGTPIRWSLVRGSVDGFAVNGWGWHPLMPLAWLPK